MFAFSEFSDHILEASSRKKTKPIWLIRPSKKTQDMAELTSAQITWLKNTGWEAKGESYALVPGENGEVEGVVLTHDLDVVRDGVLHALGKLPDILPEGNYHLAGELGDADFLALSWLMGCYHFDAYKTGHNSKSVCLKFPDGLDRDRVIMMAQAVCFARDLINIPANDFGPEELEEAARFVAKTHKAKFKSIVGEALLKENFPLIHAVGRASPRAPRLIDISWGNASKPKITLVGKGICYDTGGLNIKPGNSMSLMKKDMGGAATVLALAHMIMSAKLPVSLRVLIPAAENNIAGNAFRPGDIIKSRQGMTVEIDNTDAEGRLVLADALALADEETPDHMFTFATLTGAARVALGPDLPPFYTTDDHFAGQLGAVSMQIGDPLWRMPFWKPYDKMLKGKVGDVNHVWDSSFAGSISAALFLKRFVSAAKAYSHFDIYGWMPTAKPGKPFGGEPQGARAVFKALEGMYR